MKKLLLALALVLCFNAAKADGFGIGFGPKFGYQTTTLSLKSADIKNSIENNWTAGVFVRMHIGSFIIHPELMYFKSEKVLNFEGFDLSGENPKITLNQQNLSLPVYLGYLLDGGLFKARFCVGPVAYFLVGQKQSDNAKDIVDVKDIETNKVTWGAALNIGVDVWRVTLDVSYSFGLSNLFGTDHVDWSVGSTSGSVNLDSTKQNMFMVTLGFRFLD